MTERKIDPSYVDRLVRDEALHSLGELCKSLIADRERLDWINENCVLYIPGAEPDGHDQVCWNEAQGKTLRQAIDERMVQ